MTETNEPRPRRSSQSRRHASSHHQAPGASGDAENGKLIRATIVAMAVAAVVLVIAVLPAEYGIDPTGAGSALGLTKMAEAGDGFAATGDQVQTAQQSAATADVVYKTEASMRTDTLSVTLAPGEGAEVKARMKAGERMLFEWVSAGGPVNFDMHGEGSHAGSESTSYWADMQKESEAGVFAAPVDGTHGWYWRNRGEEPVEVTVTTSGFYTELYRVK